MKGASSSPSHETARPAKAAPAAVAAAIEACLKERDGSQRGDEITACCPFHDDEHPSFSFNVTKQCFTCRACGVSGGWNKLAKKLCIEVSADRPASQRDEHQRISATYDYTDKAGKLLFQVVRYEPKNFRQRRPNGTGGWLWNLDGAQLAPYRLRDLLRAKESGERVFVVEGEKDADRLSSEGLIATTAPMGAGKWRGAYTPHFQALDVIVIPDADAPGRRHAEQVSAALLRVARSVAVLELPGPMPKGSDVSDWLDGPGSVEQLVALAAAAPLEAGREATGGPRLAGASGVPAIAGENTPTPGEAGAPDWRETDTGMAGRFVEQFGKEIRYCEDLGGWLAFDGGRWERKATPGVYQRIAQTAERVWSEVPTAPNSDRRRELARFASRADSAPGKKSALALARYIPPVPAKVEEFDRDPLLLNATNGTIDLRTGTLRPHCASDLMTKRAAVAYHPSATCPTWTQFLEVIFPDDPSLIAYVQRALGYSCTGDVSEHVLFFAHGAGRNGKSTLLGTVQAVLGNFTHTADPELLLQRRGEVHPTNIAALRGARFVTSIEAEDGRRFAEVLVKWLTGGDRLTARHMRQDFFEFDPTHHLWLAANHRPEVRGADAGIWSRIHLIPFGVHLPTALGEQYDPHFRERLTAEYPGILRWLVDGCREWLTGGGLRPPPSVVAATEAYRREMDIVDRFVTERCVEQPAAKCPASVLYSAYKGWSDEVGEWRMSAADFTERVRRRTGVSHRRSNSGAFWIGVEVRGSDGQ